MTDANGYDLVEHPVYVDGSESFSASFVPVDASITAGDYDETSMFSVWNDRPQAGSVHGDGSINLLVRRLIDTNDYGGIPERVHKPEGILTLSFQLKAFAQSETGKWIARR